LIGFGQKKCIKFPRKIIYFFFFQLKIKMSYDNFDASSVYSFQDSYSYVNGSPDYRTLGSYYQKPNCPYRSVPGECAVQPTLITPTFGGVGYNIPGFNQNMNDQPLSEANYFNLSQAYPQYCKRPCIQSTYTSS